MTPERYQKAGHLYHAALEIEPEARAAFLDEACGSDQELRREAESLLRAHDKVGDYFAAPALEVAAGLFPQRQNLSLAGQSLSHYRVLSLIGAGGMGEVYLAEDTSLGRKVALKLLPKEFTEDPGRVRRFELEARAASSLNHPNIVTIFEVGQVDGRHFIATEYIDGQTLRERLSGTQLEMREALEVAAQIANALEAAHEAGIVHRDIKPENVMVRRNGLVKVLDFGLAKLAEKRSLGAGSEAPTVIGGETTPGMVLGTVSYMSPEQARGLKVDARSDNFSLGVVMYEMVAGRCPSEGATASDVIAAILKNEPFPLSRFAKNVPAEMDRIVAKALCKDREQRYQTARELSVDLKSLKQELDAEARLNRSLQPGTDKALGEKISNHQYIATEPGRGYRFVASGRERSMQPNQAGAGRDSQARKPKAILVLTILAVLAAGISIGAYIFITRRIAAPFETMKMTPLTTSGVVSDAVISPDGKYVIYVAGKPGRQSVSIRQVSTANDREIIDPEDVTYFGLTFSRDGNHIYYVRTEKDNPLGYLYRMPTLGGVSKKLATDVDSRIALSPDGSRLAFVRYDPREKTSALIVANTDGSEERILASRTGSEGFAQYDAGPAWSPDGKTIACAANNHDDAGSYMNVIEVSIEQATQQPLGSDRWYNIGQVVWLEDGSGIVMTAARQISFPVQVWSISRASAEARRITNDLNDYRDVSLTADNAALLIVNTVRVSSLWIVPGGRAALAKQITPGKFDGETGLTWTPDHKIIYTSRKSGNLDLWVMDEDGGNQKQLTADAGTNSSPSISTDGHYILFCSDRSGAPNVWRMERDGSNPMRLTRGSLDDSPFCSPDGRWVFYQGTSFDMPMLSKVPIDGGDSVVVSERFVSRHPTISPDGRLIAVNTFDIERQPHNRAVAIISSESGRTITVLDSPSRMVVAGFVWASDARSLTYIDERDGVSNIWSLPLAGGSAKPLTDFNSDRIFRFEWSRDGKQLLCARGVETSDVVLIRNFK